MIARIIILILILTILPEIYLYKHHIKRNCRKHPFIGWLWLLPGILMAVYAVVLAFSRHFAPANTLWINLFLLLSGVLTMPKAVYSFCSWVGLKWRKYRGSTRNWGNLVGVFLALFCVYATIYGFTIGFRQLEVKHVDLYFSDLPKAFEGYRIAQFSDLHIGTYTGSKAHLAQVALDSVQAQHADVIVFTGDIQNLQPMEIYPFRKSLAALKARDCVFSVLGNHDYGDYVSEEPAIKVANERETQGLERRMGWQLLMNEHAVLHRGKDSIVIAGEEDFIRRNGKQPADLSKTLTGVEDGAFVIMLQHDPQAWHKSILKSSKVQLTLSGHTHGGQFELFGMRFTRLLSRHDLGLYKQGECCLYVNAGIGGLVPFRFGMPSEITVFTLHKKP